MITVTDKLVTEAMRTSCTLVGEESLIDKSRATEYMKWAIGTGIANDLDSDVCILAIYDLTLQGITPNDDTKLDIDKFISILTNLHGKFPEIKTSWGLERFQLHEIHTKIIRLFISVEDHLNKREVVERLGAICFNQGMVGGKFLQDIRDV
jgi:hypothetical protein